MAYTYTFDSVQIRKNVFSSAPEAVFNYISQVSISQTPSEASKLSLAEARSAFRTRSLSLEKITELLHAHKKDGRIDLGNWGIHRHQLVRAHAALQKEMQKPTIIKLVASGMKQKLVNTFRFS